jgi:hypothetical protein
MPEETKTMISSEFDVLNNARSSSLERKRECAGLVLPSLLPDVTNKPVRIYRKFIVII